MDYTLLFKKKYYKNEKALRKDFLSFCELQKLNRRALIFAIVLFDRKNAQINKVFKDEDYWFALNEISAEILTVFHIFYKESNSKYLSSTEEPKRLLYPVEIEGDLKDWLSKGLGVNADINIPCVLFFQVQEEKILDTFFIELVEEKVEEAFIELKVYFESAIQSLSQVKEEYTENRMEIFELVKRSIRSTKTFRSIKKYKPSSNSYFWKLISFLFA